VVSTGIGNDDPQRWVLRGREILFIGEKGLAAPQVKASISEDGKTIHMGGSDPAQADKGWDLIRA
jgi:hypothetical protein